MIDNRILALDGTKIKGNASLSANMTYEKIENEIREYVDEILKNDAKEDLLYGEETPEWKCLKDYVLTKNV